jgi:signal transduction histidine kinase
MRLDFKPQKAREVLDEIIRSMRKQLEEKGQEVLIDLPDDLPSVWADRTRFSQVMTNLVSNSYKYTPQGGKIRVFGEACDNQWAEGGAPHVVHFVVSDTGIGIGPDDQKKIFQKFFRSEDPKTREVPGTGLGLNITKSLVELQGGTIWFESEIGQGTSFHFTLPVTS